jgi:hypothetical protein
MYHAMHVKPLTFTPLGLWLKTHIARKRTECLLAHVLVASLTALHFRIRLNCSPGTRVKLFTYNII